MKVVFEDTELEVTEYVGIVNQGENDYRAIYNADVLTFGVAVQMTTALFANGIKGLSESESAAICEALEVLKKEACLHV